MSKRKNRKRRIPWAVASRWKLSSGKYCGRPLANTPCDYLRNAITDAGLASDDRAAICELLRLRGDNKTRNERKRNLPYGAYLRSSHWKQRRRTAIESAGGVCSECGSDKQITVHHLNYDHIYSEPDGDLVVLCRKCHNKRHPRKRRLWQRARSVRLDGEYELSGWEAAHLRAIAKEEF